MIRQLGWIDRVPVPVSPDAASGIYLGSGLLEAVVSLIELAKNGVINDSYLLSKSSLQRAKVYRVTT